MNPRPHDAALAAAADSTAYVALPRLVRMVTYKEYAPIRPLAERLPKRHSPPPRRAGATKERTQTLLNVEILKTHARALIDQAKKNL